MCIVSVIFTLGPQSPPATGEQRAILCASCSCPKEGSLLSVFLLHQWEKEFNNGSQRHRTHSCFCGSLSPTAHNPTHACPYTALSILPIYPAHALFDPSLWSSKLPMLNIWKHLYIYSISTLLLPRQAALCIFHLQGWMTYILSLAPCNHSSPLLNSVLLLSNWPEAAAVGVAPRLNWNGYCKAQTPIQSNLS